MTGGRRTRPRGRALARLVSDQAGQDLIEYGLLVATIGIAGALILPIVASKLGRNYSSQSSSIQNHWQPCEPGVMC